MKAADYQRNLLDQYLNVSGEPTLKDISKETGIQHTRVFRILNGAELKLSEYKIIKNLIDQRMGNKKLEDLALRCSSQLSQKSINEIEDHMKRLITLKNIKVKSQDFFVKTVC